LFAQGERQQQAAAVGAAAGTQQSGECRGARDVRAMLAPGHAPAPEKQGIAGSALG